MKQKNNVFEEMFLGINVIDDRNIIIGKSGELSVIFKMENPNLQYCADLEKYEFAHALFGQLLKVLGEDFVLQKSDIITRHTFSSDYEKQEDYLDKVFFKHFEGREYKKIETYLTVTHTKGAKGKLKAVDKESLKAFLVNLDRVEDIMTLNKVKVCALTEKEVNLLHRRFLASNFKDDAFSIKNIKSNDTHLVLGNKAIKTKILYDIDKLNVPNEVAPVVMNTELGRQFPTNPFTFLLNVPNCDIIYTQVISVPNQLKTRRDLEAKQKRHHGLRAVDKENDAAIQDIDEMFTDMAISNEMLVQCCFSISVITDTNNLSKADNFIDTSLFSLGFTASDSNCNQLELFRAIFPANSTELKDYDMFLTSRPAAVCFIFNERIQETEDSDYLLYFTDRQGAPIGIDTSELPMHTQRITNRNKFILGPSGTGKSFLSNRYLKSTRRLGADVVIIDTGDSYLGTCNYFGGRYITYTAEKPITMNPFNIGEAENNEEKRELLKSLIALIWKGPDGSINQVEDSVLGKIISDYYIAFFEDKTIDFLSFNSFYEFSLERIGKIIKEEGITFNLSEYRFVLRKFYQGGEYDTILNDNVDKTLFEEKFIVFEIDNIKEHKLLFPITTLIIMDVFLQKMKHRKNTKKILVIEEAWKAIASPLMANYILYLYKTIRKYAGEAIVVTQELADIIGNPIVKDSIIANSDTILLLDQRKFIDRYQEISEMLSINEVERNKIFTVNRLDNTDGRSPFREFYMRRGSVGEVYGVEVPMAEYLTYTTEKAERECLEIYLRHYGNNYELALESMLSDFEKSKLKLPAFVKKVNDKNSVPAVELTV